MNKTLASPRNRREIDDLSLNTAARTHERALIGSTIAEPGRRGKQGAITRIPGKGQRQKRPPRAARFFSPAATLPRRGAPASGPLSPCWAGPAPPSPPREALLKGENERG